MDTPANALSAWHGRIDAIDGDAGRRWHQVVRVHDATVAGPGVTLVGLACDAGIRRNHGRPGAAAGPPVLRRYLANLAWHGADARTLSDAGDVVATGDELEAAQEQFARRVADALRAGRRVIGLGGGHEIAWASYQGLAQAWRDDPRLGRVGIVNFDAHFDLRQPEQPGRGSSGTPFLQIAEARAAAGLPFDYLCLGLAESANTPALFERAARLGVDFVTDVECASDRADAALRAFVARCDAIYCTFCLDVLPASVAPGVSAPSGLGLPLLRAIELLRTVLAECRRTPGRDKLALADVAELSPAHDAPDARTARTAARVVYELAAVGR